MSDAMQRVKPYACRIAVALLVGFVLIGGAYCAFRLRALYTFQTDVATFVIENRNAHEKVETEVTNIEARLNNLERILFGDMIAQLEKNAKTLKPPAPNWVELWQKNRDKELRDRINALERRMYLLER